MVRLVPLARRVPGILDRRVRLTLVAPHVDGAALPVLTGRLAGAVPGYFGVLRYLVELDAPLPPGFDPVGELPWFARGRRTHSVLVTPAPDAPTLQTPPDLIGETLEQGGMVHVFVSVAPDIRATRGATVRVGDRCPFLCMADLEPVAEPSIPPAPTPRA